VYIKKGILHMIQFIRCNTVPGYYQLILLQAAYMILSASHLLVYIVSSSAVCISILFIRIIYIIY